MNNLEHLEKEGLQEHNRLWWSQNPMSYDWHRIIAAREGTREFFEEIDARFIHASPFYRGERPFERLIPFDNLKGKRVLEIGCGLGLHVKLLSEAGASVTAIDLTPKAVELTQKRLSLRGLPANVQIMDAEQMEFRDQEFDFIWSWGVIHHSAYPERIIRNAYRVLKPSGEFRLMVYHRQSLNAYLTLIRGVLSGKTLRGMSISDILNFYNDGYVARFYTRAELSKLLLGAGFSTASINILGQKSELIPLPGRGLGGRLKSALLSKVPNMFAERILSAVGGFLFAVGAKSAG